MPGCRDRSACSSPGSTPSRASSPASRGAARTAPTPRPPCSATPSAPGSAGPSDRPTGPCAPAPRPGVRAGAADLEALGAPAAPLEELLRRLGGPVPQHPYDAARLAWYAGLLDRAHRSGRAEDAWYDGLRSGTSVDELLQQVPEPWAADVVAVQRRAERALAPLAEEADRPPLVGPSPSAAHLVPGGAEADLVVGGTAVDVKVTGTTKTRLRDLQQVVVIALLDADDELAITHVALAPVRFGVLVRWDLAALLADLAGEDVSVADLRADLREHLERAATA